MTHQPPSDIQALVRSCSESLRKTDPSALRAAFRPAPAGGTGMPTREQLDDVYATACRLCDAGSFQLAAPLALHLTASRPTEPRFSFIAGTCLQRLAIHPNAAQMFCLCLLHGGCSAAALYRLGECLLATGDKPNAARVLEAAFDLSRESEDAAQLQALSEKLIVGLMTGSKAR